MLDQCSESCGWASGIIAAFCLGSFGVPIKFISSTTHVDPLVMQTYKSVVCFMTCWLVIPLGESVKFTPLGILSGLFWVPGATAGIYGIRNAGLAISVGTWSSIIVMISFFWGVLVFHEQVRTMAGAIGAAVVLILGLLGMSVYSAPTGTGTMKNSEEEQLPLMMVPKSVMDMSRVVSLSSSSSSSCTKEDDHDDFVAMDEIELTTTKGIVLGVENNFTPTPKPATVISRRKKMDEKTINYVHVSDVGKEKEDDSILIGGKVRLSRRQLGILGAVVNGAWGGNNMVPLHYARKQGFHGAGYLISYSCGSMIVTIFIWMLRYVYNLYLVDFDAPKGYNALPSFHLREMWLAGILSGSLYSLGNFCSILAVTSLGQGVGYSLVQTSMLVSGIWGIFFFREVRGCGRICKWILSSIVTVAGILWLSYEHQGTSAH